MATKKTQGQILSVNAKGLFIDGKPTTTYNGATIEKAGDFAKVLGTYFAEVEIMQSDLSAECGESGKPAPDDAGLYTWVRAKVKGGFWSDWLRLVEYTGYPIVAKEPLQSNQEQVRRRLKRNILADAFVLTSTKRPQLKDALLNNLEKKAKKIANLIASLKEGKKKVNALDDAKKAGKSKSAVRSM